MIKSVLIVLFTFCLVSFSKGQEERFTLHGTLKDEVSKAPLIGSTIQLIDTISTVNTKYTTSNQSGQFEINQIKQGNYLLKITYIGYMTYEESVTVDQNLDLKEIYLSYKPVELNSVEIAEILPPVSQKGDTVQYNAKAYKTNPDASAEDLIKKMPGVVIDGGVVQAQGEDVKKVLVDGKPFFGDDPNIALKNLPAEVISKIQVFDKLSEQAEFTGFDDGESVKTINIVTKAEFKDGSFGNMYGGYGTDERYKIGGNYNDIDGERRVTILGMSNNVNNQNYSSEDLLGVQSSSNNSNKRNGRGNGRGGAGSRGGTSISSNPSDFLIGDQSGINTSNSMGLNYYNNWRKKLTISCSYFMNLTNNTNEELFSQEFFLPNGQNQFYDESSFSTSDNFNNRINVKLAYQLNSSNSFIINPRLSFQTNKLNSSLNGLTVSSGERLINTLSNDYTANTSGYNLDNSLLFRHSFDKRGRTISYNLITKANNAVAQNDLQAESVTSDSPTLSESTNQESEVFSNGYLLGGNLIYTEPISRKILLQLNYKNSYNYNFSDKEVNSFDPILSSYSIIDTSLSNNFENNYFTNEVGISFRAKINKVNINVGTSLQNAELISDQKFPNVASFEQSFFSILPVAMLKYKVSQNKSFRFMYRTKTTSPQLDQLQEVLDNTNPLFLTIGNADLKQSYNHVASGRYSITNTEKKQSIFLFAHLNKTLDYIANSEYIATDSTVIVDGVTLNEGAQLSKTINLDGYYSGKLFTTYAKPLAKIKSNLNFNSGLNWSRTPSLINNAINYSNNYLISEGLVLSSNISKAIDFTLGYTINYNIVKNSSQQTLGDNYLYHKTQASFNWIWKNGIVIKNNFDLYVYRGLASEFNQQYALWNLSVGKKIFKNQEGDISISIFDVLNQNNSINRIVTDTYIEDSETNVLDTYAMLTFSYKFKNENQTAK